MAPPVAPPLTLHSPDAAASGASGDGDLASSSSSKSFERASVVVTDVRSFYDISVQMAREPRVEWIAATLRGASLDASTATLLGGPAAKGSLVAAKFSADGQWYRARVDHSPTADGGARVTFVDFGNSEAVPASSLRRLPAELAATPPQALVAKLSFVKSPPSASSKNGNDDGDGYHDDEEDEFSLAASDLVAAALGGGAPLEALVVSRGATAGSGGPGKALSLVIVAADAADANGAGGGADSEGSGDDDENKDKSKGGSELSTRDAVSRSVNAELLRAGLLRLDKPRFARKQNSPPSVPQHLSEALSALEEAQDAARRGRRGIWEYGDPGGDSDDDERRVGGGGGGARGWGAARR